MEEFMKDNFKLILLISIVGNSLWILAYVLYRVAKGKRRITIPDQDIRFSEKWVSGVSHKSFLTRLGAARNCLTVVLSSNALVIRPMFPLNLMFFSEIYDLERYIPRNKIKHIQPGEDNDKGSVVIEFDFGNEEKRIELLLRKKHEFLRAVGV